MIEVILGAIVLISFIMLISTIINNRFVLAVIKIDKAEEDIDMYLLKKKDLLDRTRPIIEKELKIKDFLSEIDQNFDEINNFTENDILKKSYNDLLKIIDENEKLLKSEALQNILEDLKENEENIVGAIRFYNDVVVEFNGLIISFPSNMVALFKRYKRKDFYNNEKKEMFEILNEK